MLGNSVTKTVKIVCHCVVSFVKLIQTQVTWEEGTSTEKLPPSYRPVSMSVGHFLG